VSLVVAPCSHDAAKYAVLNWHYSRTMPRGALVKYGVWEDSKYVGVVVFGRGARDYGGTYGLDLTECAELVRVALRSHRSAVTEIVAKSMRLLKAANPELRLLISFADPEQGHVGGIYQAGNWIYAGTSLESDEWIINGRRTHGRQVSHIIKRLPPSDGSRLERLRSHVDPDAQRVKSSSKYRYLYPLDRAMRRQVQRLALPYPSADEGSTVSRDTSGDEVQVRPLPSAPERPTDA
jgi:hypothetical protein